MDLFLAWGLARAYFFQGRTGSVGEDNWTAFFFQVVTWGSADSGGDSRLVSERLQNVWDVQATAPR